MASADLTVLTIEEQVWRSQPRGAPIASSSSWSPNEPKTGGLESRLSSRKPLLILHVQRRGFYVRSERWRSSAEEQRARPPSASAPASCACCVSCNALAVDCDIGSSIACRRTAARSREPRYARFSGEIRRCSTNRRRSNSVTIAGAALMRSWPLANQRNKSRRSRRTAPTRPTMPHIV